MNGLLKKELQNIISRPKGSWEIGKKLSGNSFLRHPVDKLDILDKLDALDELDELDKLDKLDKLTKTRQTRQTTQTR